MPAPPPRPTSEQAPATPRRRSRLRRAVLVGVSVTALVAAGLYLARGQIGAGLATAYLQRRGVPSHLVFDRLGPGGFVAHGSLGPAGDPDLTVQRVEVTLGPIPLFSGGGLVPNVRSVRLVRPRLKGRLHQGKLSFGSLQRLLDEAAASPTAGPSPAIVVQDGELRLTTDAGLVHLIADAALDQGRLVRLSGRLAPTVLRQGELRLQVEGGSLNVRPDGQAARASGKLALSNLSAGALSARDVSVVFALRSPYPAEAFAGAFSVDIDARAAAFAAPEARTGEPRLKLALAGRISGPLDQAAFAGQGRLDLTASNWSAGEAGEGAAFALGGPLTGVRLARGDAGLRFALAADLAGQAGAGRLADLRFAPTKLAARLFALEGLAARDRGTVSAAPQLDVSGLRLQAGDAVARGFDAELSGGRGELEWSRDGWRVEAPLRLQARADRLVQPLQGGEVGLRGAALSLSGSGAIGPQHSDLTFNGSFRTAGGGASGGAARALAGAVPIISADDQGRAALERAFGDFRVDAPAFALRAGSGGLSMGLTRPVAVVAGDGARAELAQPGPGRLALRVSGGGLPEVSLDATHLRAGMDGGGPAFSADTKLELGFSGDSYRGARLALDARAVRRAGRLAVTAGDCGELAIASFGDAAEPLVVDLAGRLCPEAGRPLLALGPGRDWRLDARLQDLRFTAPASEAAARDGVVALALAGDRRTGEPAGRAEILSGRLVDVAAMRRFEPMRADGRLDLAGGVWSGPVQIRDGKAGRPVAEVQVRHVMETGVGHADIAAPALAFARDGLQPRDLSPIGADMVSDAEGTVRFTGEAEWGVGDELVSHGKLSTSGFDFRSPFGGVRDARAEIAFTSLAPLLSEPDQPVGAEHIDAVVPLADASAAVTFKEDRLTVSGATAVLANGKVALDPIDFPFDQTVALTGTVRLDDVDLGELIKQFNLADKVKLQASVDGSLPFTYGQERLRLTNGRIYATGPGRLSIDPEALTGAAATPAPGAPPVATPGMQNFAYQALQDLAFDRLEAEVGSQPGGRLGVLFRIHGRHDPPKGGDVRLGLLDLLRGKAFDKPIDLPKDTPVNLTLDTSLNLDELLAAYAGQTRAPAARSQPVQAPSANP